MKSRRIAISFLVLAVILMAAGGYADLFSHDRHWGASKQHLWADGTFLLILSGWALLWGHLSEK